MHRRYIGLWFPFLSADAWRLERVRQSEATETQPLVFIEKVRGASRLAQVDRTAREHGLLPAMTLADARARVPELHAVPFNGTADAVFLERLAETSIAFTPSVATETRDSLTLDITGCAHLFGGEAHLVSRLQRALRAAGTSAVKAAVAPTPDMANALARFAPTAPIFAHDDQAVRELPVAAFECAREDALALRRVGLRTIGDVGDRPSVLFTARFTPAFTTKLARILGEEDRHITPRRPPPERRFEQRCAEPVASADVIMRLVDGLAWHACRQLEAQGEGGRLFEASFFRTDGAIRRIRVEAGQPTRARDVILRLYRDRLDAIADPLDPGFGFDLIRFEVLRAEPYGATQTSLDGHESRSRDFAALLDRLGARFGRDRIGQLAPVDTHIPEAAQMRVPATAVVPSFAATHTAAAWDSPRLGGMPSRPLRCFEPPQAIEVNASATDGEPICFRWRRVEHNVAAAEGPERIASAWWSQAYSYGTRDYYRVETPEGRRFWLFRADAAELVPRPVRRPTQVLSEPTQQAYGTRQPRWFLHGVFA